MLRENQNTGWEGGNFCDNRLEVHRNVMWNYWCVDKILWSWLNLNFDETWVLIVLVYCVTDLFIWVWSSYDFWSPFHVVTLTLIYFTYKFGFNKTIILLPLVRIDYQCLKQGAVLVSCRCPVLNVFDNGRYSRGKHLDPSLPRIRTMFWVVGSDRYTR